MNRTLDLEKVYKVEAEAEMNNRLSPILCEIFADRKQRMLPIGC